MKFVEVYRVNNVINVDFENEINNSIASVAIKIIDDKILLEASNHLLLDDYSESFDINELKEATDSISRGLQIFFQRSNKVTTGIDSIKLRKLETYIIEKIFFNYRKIKNNNSYEFKIPTQEILSFIDISSIHQFLPYLGYLLELRLCISDESKDKYCVTTIFEQVTSVNKHQYFIFVVNPSALSTISLLQHKCNGLPRNQIREKLNTAFSF